MPKRLSAREFFERLMRHLVQVLRDLYAWRGWQWDSEPRDAGDHST